MKNFKNFLNEGTMDTSDFEFQTKLSDTNVWLYLDDEYDDHEDEEAIVYWKLRFEWFGNDGIEYFIDIDKVEIKYLGVNWVDEGEDIKEEKSLTFDNSEDIDIEQDKFNNQIIPKEVNVDKGKIQVIF